MLIPLFIQAASQTLVSIGAPDRSATEFALAPGGYARYRADGTFVAGVSKADSWPYVLPGPQDGWAGSRSHEATVYFGIGKVAQGATARLVVDLVETQAITPPELELRLNDTVVALRSMPKGNGDDAIEGHPEKGKPSRWVVDLPSAWLRMGTNRLDIRSVAGSWAVFDALRIEGSGLTPKPVAPDVRLTGLASPQAILRTPRGPRQTVRIEATNLGPPTRRRFVLAGEPLTTTLATGTQTLEFSISPVAKRTSLEVRTDRSERSRVTIDPIRPWKILLFPHAHVDVGYTDLQTDVERNHRRNLFDALQVARESAGNPVDSRYRYNIEASWVLDRFLQNATPTEFAQVRGGLQRGDLAVTGGYANELTAAMRPEEMMQAYRTSRRLEDRFGVRIDTASQTDVPGVSWGDVTALHEAGISNLVLMPNNGDRIGTIRQAWEDKPFWWIGPSGEKVFLWELVGYGMAHGIRPFDGHRDRIFRTADPTKDFIGGYVFPLLEKYAAQHYPYDLIGIPWSVNDNSPIDGDVPAAAKAWNEKYLVPHVEVSTLSHGCHEFLARYGDRIPSHRGDLTPYWEDGMGSSAKETAMNRASADRLVQDATMAAIFHPSIYPADRFIDAWRNVLLYSEHTWGAYNSISEPDSPFVKAQWATKQKYALDAEQQSELLGSGVGRGWYDVVNTTSWVRSGLISLLPPQSSDGDRVVDDKGRVLRSQRDAYGNLEVLVTDVPASGSRRIHCVPGPIAEGPPVRADESGISGPGFSLSIDTKTGGVAHWIQGGREWVKPGESLSAYEDLPGTDLKNLVRPSHVRVEVLDAGPLVARIREIADVPGEWGLYRNITVVAGLPGIVIDNDLDKKPVRTKEGGHFLFPFAVPGGQVRIDTPWAVVRPEIDQLPGSNKNWFCTQRFVDVSNDNYGITLSSLDAPLVEVGGITANLLGSVPLDAWRKHVESTQTVASWAFNNHWHTNYRADQAGPLTFRYALLPHGPYSADAAMRFGTEVAQPLVVRTVTGPPVAPLLTLSDPRVLVTSLSPSDDGKALIVRLYGASGKTLPVTLHWRSGAVGKQTRSDLSQRPGAALGGVIVIPANGVITVRAELMP